NVELKDGALTINKNSTARVVLTANSDTKQYNGATQSVSGFTVTGLLGEDAADVAKATSGISAGASAKNAGRYSTAFSGSNAELEQNYANIEKVDGALTINKNSTARVVLTANSDTKEYNGATQSVSGFTVMGLLGEDAADAAKATSGISAGASARNAGRYSTAFSGSNAELEQNYANIDKVDGALTINKNSTARVVLAATGGTVEYNGSLQAVSGFTAEGLVGADKADNLGVSSGAQGRNAGRYGTAFQNTEQLQANYANVELRDAVLVIEPKTVTLASITAADKVYDGSTAASITQATVVGTVAGETLSVLGEGQFEDKNVGQAKTVSVADVQSLRLVNGSGDWRNYKLQTAGALTSRASITPKLLSVLGGSVADKVFDGNVNASFTMGRLDGLVGQETLVVQGIDARFRDAQVGSDKPVDVRLSLANGANGGLVSNYILPEQLYRAAIQSSDQRPVDPRPIPPKDVSPSRVAFLPPTSAGVSCRVEDLEAEYQRSGSVSDERLKQCACELTEETGVLICYAPQSETVAANVGKDR
ncbi:YDG domain-containing protein, partial [Kinneretia asaccharophila]|uniref:YDG domain-containing protein n=1 Tax=Roseateles asaccharophilus TaxID=582607 RepID=UPI001476E265